MSRQLLRRLGLILIISCASAFVLADEVKLNPNHPDRYTVVKGDTLWDIAKRFLQSPWHWARVWTINEQIKNPHLIYPGDVIVLNWVNGKPSLTVLRTEKQAPSEDKGVEAPMPPVADTREPIITAPADGRTIKLKPRAHAEPIESAIPTITPSMITPFLTQPLAIGERELENAGYVTIGLDNRIALGDQSEFYARGLKSNETEYYQIFRPGKPIHDPETDELLAYEAIYLGDARKLEGGDPTKLVVTRVKQEILPTDRLLASDAKPALPYYYPRAPKTDVRGWIVSAPNSVAEIGTQAVVGISLGKRNGVEEGHVLRVLRHAGTHMDPLTRDDYKLPDEESALVMVFRTFDKVSYALVMNATRPVNLGDRVVTP